MEGTFPDMQKIDKRSRSVELQLAVGVLRDGKGGSASELGQLPQKHPP